MAFSNKNSANSGRKNRHGSSNSAPASTPVKTNGTSGQAVGTIRINKAIAAAGICSRRQADELINMGFVRLNGELVQEPGVQASPGDSLEVRGKTYTVPQLEREFSYVMLNKPVQVVTTVNDPEGRQTVIDILPEAFRKTRLYPVGRLDFFSEGLLLLTDDGELTQRLTHPRYHLPKIYEVLVREEATREQLEIVRKGMLLAEGEKLAPVQVTFKGSMGRGFLYVLTLHQGVNRQIRRMFRDFNLTILSLRRVAQGPLELAGLKSGKCRHLEPEEVAAIRKACGLK